MRGRWGPSGGAVCGARAILLFVKDASSATKARAFAVALAWIYEIAFDASNDNRDRLTALKAIVDLGFAIPTSTSDPPQRLGAGDASELIALLKSLEKPAAPDAA